MKLVKKFALLCFVSTTTIAANNKVHTSTIKSVYSVADGKYVLVLNEDHDQCTNGNSPKYYYVDVGKNAMTEKGADRIYSAALLAAASQKSVTFHFDADAYQCDINALRVDF